MEWLWWALLLLLVMGWPLLFVLVGVVQRRVGGAPRYEQARGQHAELRAWEDAQGAKSGRGWY